MELEVEQSHSIAASKPVPNDPEPRAASPQVLPYHVPAVSKIRPRRGWAALHLGEVWRFRELLLTLAGRDVKIRYKQTALGVIWVILQPLLAAGIFSFVFGKVAKLSSGEVPYFIFSYCGLLAWNAFSNTLSKSSASLIGNSQLISKIYFPRLILPLSTIPSTLIDFAVALAMLAVIMPSSGVHPGWGIVLMPVWLALILLLSTGLGLITSALTVSYRDVQYILPVLLQLMLYASPVAYEVTKLNLTPRQSTFYFLNPLSSLLEAFRWSLLGPRGGTLMWSNLWYSAAVSVSVFVVGLVGFSRMERRFADVI